MGNRKMGAKEMKTREYFEKQLKNLKRILPSVLNPIMEAQITIQINNLEKALRGDAWNGKMK